MKTVWVPVEERGNDKEKERVYEGNSLVRIEAKSSRDVQYNVE